MRTLLAALTMCLLAVPVQAQYSGGTGEPNDPYQIATAADLIALGETPEDYDKHFILTADIDLDPNLPGRKVFDKAVIAPAGEPLFSGVFDGSGHTISHLTVAGKEYLGLFGRVGSWYAFAGEVKNVGLVDVKITGTGNPVGGLVGWNRGRIAESYSSGSVRGDSSVGGLAGSNGGRISTSYSSGWVSGRRQVGGFVGWNYGTIASSYSSGSVSGDSVVGGLAGSNNGSISTSYSSGLVSGVDAVGGLVGSGSALDVNASVWDTGTSALFGSAGGVGLTTIEMMDGEMLGLNGFANDSNWLLDAGRDYPRLAWQGTPGSAIPNSDVDWLEGDGTAEDPYRIDTPSQLILLGKAATLWGKHFVLGADIDLDPMLPGRQIFGQAVIPAFTGVFDGRGHVISHLTVTGGSYLGLFGELYVPGSVSNLGLKGVEIRGTGHAVGGLVGDNGGSISSSFSSGSVTGTACVGGLVGENWGGSISSSFSSGSVTGTMTVFAEYAEAFGGLVGGNWGNIATSYSTGSVSGTARRSSIGGLVGANGGSIATSYSTGSVSGTGEYVTLVGGLVGDNWGSIATSYSTGLVSGTAKQSSVGGLVGSGSPERVIHGVWDTETSGLLGSAGGVGLTTAEMMDPEMLALNGLADDPNWVLDVGHDYPRLAWEGTIGQTVLQPHIDWLEGRGTPEEPYRIDTASQLVLLGKASVLWDDHFVLGGDIDLDPALSGSSVFGQAVIPVFTGVFDGGGHAISNLTIDGSSYLGLFGLVSSPAEVRDVRVVDVNVTGSGYYIGGLLGANGVFGYYDDTGTPGAMVTNCHSSGSLGGRECVGGLVGQNWRGSITNCSSSGSVSATGRYSDVGGLVGWSFGIISSCRSSGMVSGEEGAGGLVGSNGGKVGNCYSTSVVSGARYVGGLVGLGVVDLGEVGADGEITACYSTGRVSGTWYVGGLVGTHCDTVASFWDIQSSGQTTSAGGTGLTTAEMQTAQTFLDAGWDFGPTWTWWMQGYPRLSWETQGELNAGSGTDENPYQIYTREQLVFLGTASNLWDKHFILAADIDLDPNLPGGQVFTQALIPTFAGVFDGNGHSISHLTIRGGSLLGLFGELADGAVVKNLGLANASISGSGSSVGALVGDSHGSVMQCCSTGSISGLAAIAGLVGSNEGDITQCYSTSAVSGQFGIGGLVGLNDGNVTQCFGTGKVNGDGGVGGFVGYNNGSISSSFWDIQTSGTLDGVGSKDPDPNSVMGKSTDEMKTAKTFLDAGWDFVGETANGTEDLWKIAEGLDYPRLWWEPYDGRVTVVLGEVFTVTLESNPSTGYRWEWVDHQDSIVEQMGEAQFKPRETGDPPLVGAGGWESFDFKAVHQGQMTLKLVYRRPWEEGVEPLKTFSLQVTVP